MMAENNNNSINVDLLTTKEGVEDFVVTLHRTIHECPPKSKEKVWSDVTQSLSSTASQIALRHPKLEDFTIITDIGSGAAANMQLVQHKTTNKVSAMKIMDKYGILSGVTASQSYREELYILRNARNSQWLPELHYAFQDADHLYLVMEFCNGGDFDTVIIKELENGAIDEHLVKFWVAEMVLAIDSLHKLNYIHRDIKPQNFVMRSDGHVVLIDFGAVYPMNQGIKERTSVGTAEYMAPENLRGIEGKEAIGPECDYWSLGVVAYEMLFKGNLPFDDEDRSTLFSQIMQHKEHFKFPEDDDDGVSEAAKDLIQCFITDADNRLGRNGVDEIQSHPFFHGIDWDNIGKSEAPYKPDVDETNEMDVGQFEIRSKPSNMKAIKSLTNIAHAECYLRFAGYTDSGEESERLCQLQKQMKLLVTTHEDVEERMAFEKDSTIHQLSTLATEQNREMIIRLTQEHDRAVQQSEKATQELQRYKEETHKKEQITHQLQSADRIKNAQIKELKVKSERQEDLLKELEDCKASKEEQQKLLEKERKNLDAEWEELKKERVDLIDRQQQIVRDLEAQHKEKLERVCKIKDLNLAQLKAKYDVLKSTAEYQEGEALEQQGKGNEKKQIQQKQTDKIIAKTTKPSSKIPKSKPRMFVEKSMLDGINRNSSLARPARALLVGTKSARAPSSGLSATRTQLPGNKSTHTSSVGPPSTRTSTRPPSVGSQSARTSTRTPSVDTPSTSTRAPSTGEQSAHTGRSSSLARAPSGIKKPTGIKKHQSIQVPIAPLTGAESAGTGRSSSLAPAPSSNKKKTDINKRQSIIF